MRRWVVPMLAMVLLAACDGEETERPEGDGSTPGLESPSPVPAIVQEFEKAYESGDLGQVQELFTEDGMITTASNVYGMHAGETVDVGVGFVDGPDFERLAWLHGGEDLTIVGTPIQVEDNTVAFGWRWSSGGSGTAQLYLRDGKVVVAILNVSQVPIPWS